MKLYFENSYGERRIIAEPTTEEEVRKAINKFLEERNYKSYYTRVWEKNGERYYDVGSHTEFFIVTEF